MSRLYDCVFSDKLCSAFCSNRNLLDKKSSGLLTWNISKPLESEVSSFFAIYFEFELPWIGENYVILKLNNPLKIALNDTIKMIKRHVGWKVLSSQYETVKLEFVGGNLFWKLFVSEPLHIQFLLICNSNTRGKIFIQPFLHQFVLFREIISRLPVLSGFGKCNSIWAIPLFVCEISGKLLHA